MVFYKQVLEFHCPSKFLCQTSGRQNHWSLICTLWESRYKTSCRGPWTEYSISKDRPQKILVRSEDSGKMEQPTWRRQVCPKWGGFKEQDGQTQISVTQGLMKQHGRTSEQVTSKMTVNHKWTEDVKVFFIIYFFGGFFLFLLSYYIQHCFICRPSDSTVPTDAGIEPRTVATGALAVRRSNH